MKINLSNSMVGFNNNGESVNHEARGGSINQQIESIFSQSRIEDLARVNVSPQGRRANPGNSLNGSSLKNSLRFGAALAFSVSMLAGADAAPIIESSTANGNESRDMNIFNSIYMGGGMERRFMSTSEMVASISLLSLTAGVSICGLVYVINCCIKGMRRPREISNMRGFNAHAFDMAELIPARRNHMAELIPARRNHMAELIPARRNQNELRREIKDKSITIGELIEFFGEKYPQIGNSNLPVDHEKINDSKKDFRVVIVRDGDEGDGKPCHRIYEQSSLLKIENGGDALPSPITRGTIRREDIIKVSRDNLPSINLKLS